MLKKRSLKKKKECSYYSCGIKTGLATCGYCGRYYCVEHIQPRMPSSPPWIDPELEKEWRKLGHPCPAYSEAFKRMTEEQKQREYKAFNDFMDRLKKSPSWPRGAYVSPEPIHVEPSTESPTSIPIGSDYEPVRPSQKPELSDIEVIRRLIKKLRYMFGISLRSFLEYLMVAIILLIIFDVLFTGRFNLILTILRAVIITIAYYILRFIYWKTRYGIPWKWVAIAALIIVIAQIYSTSNYSIIDYAGNLFGVENLTKSSVLSVLYNTSLNLPIGNASLNTSSNSNGESIKNESLNTDTLGTDLFSSINSYRAEQGVGQLAWNDTIAAVARIYSNNTLLHGRPTDINDTIYYSVADVVTYTLYVYDSCSYNSTGSLQNCTYLKQNDALSQIDNEWFNNTSTQPFLAFQNFTDAGVGVVTNGSYAYVTLILTDSRIAVAQETQKCADNINNKFIAPIKRLSSNGDISLVEVKHFKSSSEAVSYLRDNYLFDDLSKYSSAALSMSIGMGVPNGRLAGPGIAADINTLSDFSVGIVQRDVNAYGMTTFRITIVLVCDKNGELTPSSLALLTS